MLELAQHIETLLLENDCVIIPNFGGFITHYVSSKIDEENNLFIPPTRTIGFNPQLKINDGLLVQSYMQQHDINFPQALCIIEKEVKQLSSILFTEGKVVLPNIGEIHYTMQETLSFVPYNEKFSVINLYGLDAFEFKTLDQLKPATPVVNEPEAIDVVAQISAPVEERKSNAALHFIRYSAAVAAAILFFFLLSTPIENTYLEKENHALLLPINLFGDSKDCSVITSPITIENTHLSHQKANQETTNKKVVRPIAVKEVKVASKTTTEVPVATTVAETAQPTTKAANANLPTAKNSEITTTASSSKKFHIIVGSTTDMKRANEMLATLKAKGYNNASIIDNGSRVRICTDSFNNRDEAEVIVNKLRSGNEYPDAWLFIQK